MVPRPSSEAADQAAANGAVSSDAEGWALLDGLKRRLDDQGAHTRKTATQMTQLASSIAALVDVQRRRSRTLNLNSFGAYVIFTVLCSVGFYVLYHNRARDLVDARDRALRDRNAATRRADEAAAAVAARHATDAAAWEAWQLLDAGKRSDAAKRIAALATATISPLDRAALRARLAQVEEAHVAAALKTARVAYRSGRYDEVMTILDEALLGAVLPNADSHYIYGIAALRAEEYDRAAAHLRAALAANTAESEARLRLAQALDRAGRKDEARVEYDRFAKEHPESPSAVTARGKSDASAGTTPEPSTPSQGF